LSDRTTRLLASLALAIALVALVIAGYALSLEQERTEELHELSDSVGRALRSRSHDAVRPPPLGLDEGE
jgi:hypothetical protein